jgi:hypothetical protein
MSVQGNTFAAKCEKNNLSCAICFEPYNNPHAINLCLHSFCLECIQAATNCPLCNKEFTASHLVHDFDKAERVEKIRARCLSSSSAPQAAVESRKIKKYKKRPDKNQQKMPSPINNKNNDKLTCDPKLYPNGLVVLKRSESGKIYSVRYLPSKDN